LLLSNSAVFCREINQVKLTLIEMKRRDTGGDSPSGWSAVRDYLSVGWNCIDVAGILALYGASVAHFIDSEVLMQHVGSLGVLLNGFSFLQLLTPFESTGPLIKTVIEIMGDISGYVKVLIVLLWAFSVSFAVAMPKNDAFVDGTAGPLVGLLTSFEAIVGSFHMSDFQNSESTAFFLLYLFGMVVVMLNLLIAIMGDSYEKVKESEVVEARKLRAQTIIDEEALMNDADRANPEYFPKYLQVLRATEDKEEVWAGLVREHSQSKLGARVLPHQPPFVRVCNGCARLSRTTCGVHNASYTATTCMPRTVCAERENGERDYEGGGQDEAEPRGNGSEARAHGGEGRSRRVEGGRDGD
jgi:hypothetical protein